MTCHTTAAAVKMTKLTDTSPETHSNNKVSQFLETIFKKKEVLSIHDISTMYMSNFDDIIW